MTYRPVPILMTNELTQDQALAAVEAFTRRLEDRLRFAVVADDGRHSTAWQAWATGDTVYIAGRTMGSVMKVSLHPAGDYRFAVTKEFHTAKSAVEGYAALNGRPFVQWPRPDVSDGTSITMVAAVHFPTKHLASAAPPASQKKPYLLLQAAPPGRALEVGFYATSVPMELSEQAFLARGIQPMFTWGLTDGSYIAMAMQAVEFDDTFLRNGGLAHHLQPGPGADLPAHGGSKSGLTALFWNTPALDIPLRLVEVGGVTVHNTRDAGHTMGLV